MKSSMKDGVKSPAFLITAAILIVGIIALPESSSPIVTLLGVFFVFGPLFITLIVSIISAHRTCQLILVGGSVFYALWFGWVYMSALHWEKSSQSGLAFLGVGVVSLPVMIPIWVSTLIIRRKQMNLQQNVRTMTISVLHR